MKWSNWFNASNVGKTPVFCRVCGQKLVISEKILSYDEFTGLPDEKEVIRACPNAKGENDKDGHTYLTK